jgi:hypothetical protein
VGTPEELQDRIAGRPKLQVTLKKLNQSLIQVVKEIEHVREVYVGKDAASMVITVDDLSETTPEIVGRVVRAGGMVLSVNTLRPSLEEAYLKLVRAENS